ncbi:DUF3429 domain-containing protein [Pseudomonas sp. NBRC 111130]|uniref:DUF3429 domain-containing protein n=1 Tax=Pseudomonas sp. NBRC 111130 TaxID=1661045 RepID=UPI0006D3CEF9|nr:DUF3429 domain-containing protein [Pseudomonas sp. NBRC 111130]
MSTVFDSLSPRRFTVLGYSGLLPFVGLTLLICLAAEYREFLSIALVGYGAVILSFVGALHWGFAMTLQGLPAAERQERLVWSVIPALIGWIGMLLPAPWGCFLLCFGFIGDFWQDRKLMNFLPEWYLPMRMNLTIVASLCLIIGALVVSFEN